MSDKLKKLLDRCKCGVFLKVNDHRNIYESVKMALDEYALYECPPSYDDEVRAKMIETDTIIDLHFYPDTPIGSYHLIHYDLDAVLDIALRNCLGIEP